MEEEDQIKEQGNYITSDTSSSFFYFDPTVIAGQRLQQVRGCSRSEVAASQMSQQVGGRSKSEVSN
jgi:NifU-like protein involved in Fe-S cluster formation